jgi:hypothetical protein
MIENDAAERALQLTRARITPSELDRERVRRALPVPANAPLPALAGAPAAERALRRAPLAAGPARLASVLQATAVAGLVGIGFGAGYRLGQRDASAPAPPLPPAQVVVNTALVPEPLPALPEPAAPSAPIGSKSAAQRLRTSAPPAARDDGEIELLRRSERALRAHNGQLALALVQELDESYPRTRFEQERQAIRVLARCEQREQAAQQQAGAFLREHPTSVYAQRIRTACALQSESEK